MSYYKALLSALLLLLLVLFVVAVYEPNRITSLVVTYSARLFCVYPFPSPPPLSYSFANFFLSLPRVRALFHFQPLRIAHHFPSRRDTPESPSRRGGSLSHARMIPAFGISEESYVGRDTRSASGKNHRARVRERQWQECRQEFRENA